jgi:hypothetical protein
MLTRAGGFADRHETEVNVVRKLTFRMLVLHIPFSSYPSDLLTVTCLLPADPLVAACRLVPCEV